MASIKVCDPVSVPLSVLLELSELRAEVERLRRDNEHLRHDNERLQRELAQARAERDAAQRQSRRQAAPFSKGPPAAQPRTPGRKAGPQHGRHGHRLPPLPEHIDEILQAPLPPACPGCGAPVAPDGLAAQYQTEIPRRPRIRRFDVHIGHCTGCGRRVQGRHPLQTSDALGAAASQLGPDAQAAIAVLNKDFGLPHGKVARLLGTLFGVPLTRGACAQVVLRAARRLENADQEICQELRDSERLVPDETGWRVGGQTAWLHAWVAPRVTCYAIEADRSADALEAVIGINWSGTMTHDGFASYNRFESALHQQCLGHVLRRTRDLAAQATRGAVHYPRRLIALFSEAIHLRNRHLRGEISAEALQASRASFEARLERLARPAREVPAYETLSAHLWTHLGEWFTFLDDPSVEPTNWEGEQAIRPAVVNRKVWGGNRTWAGARAQEVLMSVLRTCQQGGRSGLEFVSQTLRAFGNPALTLPALLGPR